MNFYEFQEPYYALIKAKTTHRAVTIYIEQVSGNEREREELVENVIVVSAIKAAAIFSRGKGEDEKEIPIKEIVEDLESDVEQLLILDGSLL